MCDFWNPIDCGSEWVGDQIGGSIGDAVGQSLSDMMDDLAHMMAEAALTVLGLAMSWWIQPPTMAVSDCGDLSDGTASDSCATPTGAVADIADNTWWLVGLIAAVSIVIAVIKMAVSADARAGTQTVRGILVLVVTAGMGVAVVQLLITAGDAYSRWIMDQAMGSEDAQQLLADAFESLWLTQTVVLIIIILSLVAIVVGFLQWLLLMARTAALVLMAGLLPVAAAAGVSEGGRATRDKYFAWMIAFLLYKPVAATIYAAAIWLIQEDTFAGPDGDVDVVSEITGFVVICMMFVLALAALPALMRLITPAVSAVSSGGASAGLGAAAGAASSVATGAALMGGKGGGDDDPTGPGSGGPPASGANQSGGGQSAPAPGAGQDPAKAASTAGESGGSAGAAGGAASSAGSAAGGAATGGALVAAEAVQEGIDRAKAATEATGAHAAGDTPTAQPGGPQGASGQ